MKKTTKLIKIPNTTMYFPKVECTKEEILRLYTIGHVIPTWLRAVIVNQTDVEEILESKPKRKSKLQALNDFVNQNQNNDDLYTDITLYSDGQLDLIDLSVKYGIYYKDLRKTFIRCFPNKDIDTLWKKHKKHSQKKTSEALYGVSHPSFDPQIKAKKDKTMMERYGVTHNMQSKELLKKFQDEFQKKHGIRHAFEKSTNRDDWYQTLWNTLTSDETWLKVLKTISDEYNYPMNPTIFSPQYLDIKRKDFSMSYQQTEPMETLLSAYKRITGDSPQYPSNALFQLPIDNLFSKTWLHHYVKLNLISIPEEIVIDTSQYERIIAGMLEENDIKCIRNNRTLLNGLEMDFYLPDHKVGIECNPNTTHNSNKYAISSNRTFYNRPKPKSYHYNKYRIAQEKEITLIQLFEMDLTSERFNSITVPRLLAHLKGYEHRIGARKCDLRKLTKNTDTKEARNFLNKYHARGASRANEYWGFYYQNELVGVGSFVINESVELKRLCFKQNTQIIGGISKLIKQFFKTHPNAKSIFTYSDNDLGNGESYSRAGATFVSETGPSLKFISWSDPYDTYSWQIATPWGAKTGVLAKASGTHFKTQQEIEKYIELELPHKTDHHNGYDRIYSSGSKKWLFTRETFNEHPLVGE